MVIITIIVFVIISYCCEYFILIGDIIYIIIAVRVFAVMNIVITIFIVTMSVTVVVAAVITPRL